MKIKEIKNKPASDTGSREIKTEVKNEIGIKSEDSNSEHSSSGYGILNGTSEGIHTDSQFKNSESRTVSSKGKKKNRKRNKFKTVPGIMMIDEKDIKKEDEKCLEINGSRSLKKKDTSRKVKVKFSDEYPDKYNVSLVLTGKYIRVDSKGKPVRLSRYMLATTINRIKGRIEREHGYQMPNTTFEEWKKIQDSRSEAEKAADEARTKHENVKMAVNVARLSVQLLKLLESAKVDEKQVAKIFKAFLCSPVSQTSMLHVPEFLHAVMLCRGMKNFSRQLRSLADECYQKFHCMFPISMESDFETVYMTEMKKCLPDSLDRINHIPLDYDDLSDTDSDN